MDLTFQEFPDILSLSIVRVMVLVDGAIKEFAAPADLLSDTTSLFYHMAKDARLV